MLDIILLFSCKADVNEKEKTIVFEIYKQLQENNKKLANFVRAIENGIFNDTTNERMKELEIANKDLQEKITSREMLVIKPLDKNIIYSFLCSFKDIDLTDKLACQKLVDMFINKVILYDKYCEIYFNTNGDKSKQLKLKEQPDIDSEILFENNKKEQSYSKSSDYSLMAERVGFEPTVPFWGTHDFQSCSFGPSDISPYCGRLRGYYIRIFLIACLLYNAFSVFATEI